jgi:chorismate mutase
MQEQVLDIHTIRQKIDEIDIKLHSLIEERVQLALNVGKIKHQNGDALAFRPAREAQILRQLIARHQNNNVIPLQTLVHLWREILSSCCYIQKPYSVAGYAETQSDDLRDLLRFYYGSLTQIQKCGSISQVFHAITGEQKSIGILPSPVYSNEQNNWWFTLALGDYKVHIVGTLPFVKFSEDEFSDIDYYVLSSADIEPSGDDSSFLVVKTQPEVSRTTVTQTLQHNGFESKTLAVHDDEISSTRYHFIEIPDYISYEEYEILRTKMVEQNNGKMIDIKFLGVAAKPIIIEQNSKN